MVAMGMGRHAAQPITYLLGLGPLLQEEKLFRVRSILL